MQYPNISLAVLTSHTETIKKCRNYWNIFMNWSRLLIPDDRSPIKTLEESISRGFIPKDTCLVFSFFEIEHLSIETPHSIPQCQSLCTPRLNLLGDILLKHEWKCWSIFLNILRHLRPIDCSPMKKSLFQKCSYCLVHTETREFLLKEKS